jgi:hypothetical protein
LAAFPRAGGRGEIKKILVCWLIGQKRNIKEELLATLDVPSNISSFGKTLTPSLVGRGTSSCCRRLFLGFFQEFCFGTFWL